MHLPAAEPVARRVVCGSSDRALSEMLAEGIVGPEFDSTAEEFEAAWREAGRHPA